MDDQNQQPVAPEPAYEQIPSPPVLSFMDRHGIAPVAFAMIVLIAVFFTYQIIGGIITYFLFGVNPTMNQVGGLRVVTGLGQIFLIFIPTMFFVRLATLTPAEFLRLRLPDIRTFIVPLIGIVSLQQMLQIYMIFQEKIPLPPEVEDVTRQLKEMIDQLTKLLAGSASIPELLWVILIIALIPALVEEFLFRGLILRTFERQVGSLWAVVITGIIFGAYHLNPFSFVPLVVLGVYLGFLAMRAGSLWASVAAHFYNNTYACVTLYFNVDDNIVGTGNPDQMSTGTLLVLFWFFGIIFIVSTLYFMKITPGRKPSPDPGSGNVIQ